MAYIKLENVSLHYPVYSQQTRTIKQFVFSKLGGKVSNHENHTIIKALSNIDLELRDGDRLGIVGHNGAGKTTLLRVLSEIYKPQCGTVTIDGSSSCLVDITLGMEPEATGWENIIFRCTFLGLNTKQAQKLSPAIAEFSELGEFLNMPARTYSTGMYMRLAFAITTAVSPEILIMDEMIGAGDASFFNKAIERINSLMSKTKILIIASHSNFTITSFCNKVLWLNQGSIKTLGTTDEIIAQFENETSSKLSI